MTGQSRLSIAAWAATVLGATALTPVVPGPLVPSCAFVCGIVVAAGAVLLRLCVPRPVVAVAQLAVLAEMLALLFYRETLRYAVLPFKETGLEFRADAVDALNGMNSLSAPLPPDEQYLVVLVAGVGLVGLALHVVAVHLRRPAWSGLFLLTMYSVPASLIHDGLPGLLFVPPALGYLLLLSSDSHSRVSGWGRLGGVTAFASGTEFEASTAGQASRRIGLTVIAVALVIPALLPTLPEGMIGQAGGASPDGGSISKNPLLDMGRNLRRGENVVALRYKGDGPTHLRFTALDDFDGQTWTRLDDGQEKFDGRLPPPAGLDSSIDDLERRQHEVELEIPAQLPWVPLPYPPRELSINGRWLYSPATVDLSPAAGQQMTKRYSVTSYDVKPTAQQLRNAPEATTASQHTLHVPRATPATIRQLAERVTAAAKGNHYLEALLLQRWFRETGGFRYDLSNDDASGMRALESFLFTTKVGYCEQFAAAMTLMARTLGIPARLGIGFMPGTLEDGEYVVRLHDMHAWPELYFEGIGWVRFEPTPASQAREVPSWTEPAGPGFDDDLSTAPPVTPTPGGTEPTGLPGRGERNLPDDGESGVPVQADDGWWTGAGVRWVSYVLALLAVAFLPWSIRALVRRRRLAVPPGPESVEGLWAEVRDSARDLGLDWPESATPRQSGAWLAAELPDDVLAQATRLTRAVETNRYAGATPAEADLRAEAVAVWSALSNLARRRTQWRARLLPWSWRWYIRRGTSEATDMLDRIDLALARTHSLVPRRSSKARAVSRG